MLSLRVYRLIFCTPFKFSDVFCIIRTRDAQKQIYASYFNSGFEVFKSVTVMNAVFWIVTPCSSGKIRRFVGKYKSPPLGSND
jgi:hypothetical protein